MNLNFDDTSFPDRKELRKKQQERKVFYDDIVEQAKKVELDKINFEKETFVPRSEVKQKQRVFFWIRVYLKEEMELKENTNIYINWKPTSEKLETKFICYAKKGLDKDLEDQVTNYNAEDDKKVLCLMVDEERINLNNIDIPFIKTLFKIGRYYQKQIWKRDEMSILDDNNLELPWFDIDF